MTPLTALVCPAGSALIVRVYMVCATGIPWVQLIDTARGEVLEYGTSVTDKTMSGSPTQTVAGRGWAPLAFVAPSRKTAILLTGDSKCAYFNDDYSGGQKDIGYARAIGPTLPYINAGSYGDTTAAFLASGSRRVALKRYCSGRSRISASMISLAALQPP